MVSDTKNSSCKKCHLYIHVTGESFYFTKNQCGEDFSDLVK